MPICDYSAFSSYIGFRASLCYSREPRSILDGSRSQVEKRKGAHALPTHLTLSLVSTEIVIHPDSRAGGQCKILVLSGGTPSGYLRVYRGLNAYMRLFSLFVLHKRTTRVTARGANPTDTAKGTKPSLKIPVCPVLLAFEMCTSDLDQHAAKNPDRKEIWQL